jgi:hypothetical protein
MSKVPEPGSGQLGAELPASALFTRLWDALSELLGSAATAALLKRAARRAARGQQLAGLSIRRDGLDYVHVWNGSMPALRALIGDLRPLLVEMTGALVIERLEQVLELRDLFAPQEERK